MQRDGNVSPPPPSLLVSTGGPGCKYHVFFFFNNNYSANAPPPNRIPHQSRLFFLPSSIFGSFVFSVKPQGGAGCILSSLGLISPAVGMLPSPQDSPHIISYALLALFFFLLYYLLPPKDQRPVALQPLKRVDSSVPASEQRNTTIILVDNLVIFVCFFFRIHNLPCLGFHQRYTAVRVSPPLSQSSSQKKIKKINE